MAEYSLLGYSHNTYDLQMSVLDHILSQNLSTQFSQKFHFLFYHFLFLESNTFLFELDGNIMDNIEPSRDRILSRTLIMELGGVKTILEVDPEARKSSLVALTLDY